MLDNYEFTFKGTSYRALKQGIDGRNPCIVNVVTNERPYRQQRPILTAFLEEKGIVYDDDYYKKVTTHMLVYRVLKEAENGNL